MSDEQPSILRVPEGYTVLLVKEPISQEELTDALIADALERHYGSVTSAARAVGISRRTIHRALLRRPELASRRP